VNGPSRRLRKINRRNFALLSMAIGLAPLLPAVAGSADIIEADLDVKTPDGTADAYFAHPATGAYPAVLMWTDNRGLSPTFKAMGRRLAQSGYSVLIPNPYYRFKRAPVVPVGASGGAPAVREVLVPLMRAMTAATGLTDAKAFIGFLDSQPSVDVKRKMGTCAYSMMAPLAIRTAASAPERAGAVAIFHGDGLVTDRPDSPHLLLPKMKARCFIAITDAVDKRDPGATTALRELFASAKLRAEIAVYPGTSMGWCMPDSSYYNQAQAERAWSRMLALFRLQTL
jgi:carboxymethylenebutenolidase